MSHQSASISPQRFAEALKDLSISTLHLKAAEIRNSIAHLDYSNEQLKPFADGTATTQDGGEGRPDQDCIDAIKENEVVIARMEERISLLKSEVESRGASWTEFSTAEEIAAAATNVNGEASSDPVLNGNRDTEMSNGEEHEAWRDGTFQTGRIVGREVQMDGGRADGLSGGGGRLDDEALRRAIEDRMREDDDGDDRNDGMHL